MPSIKARKTYNRFNGGLISANALSRQDLRAYTYGLKEAKGILPLMSGGVTRCGGFKKAVKVVDVNDSDNSNYSSSTPIAKMFPFAFKQEDTGTATDYWNVYLVIVAWNYNTSLANILIYEPGGTHHQTLIIDTAGNNLAFTQTSIPKIYYDQKGDVINIVDSENTPYRLQRTGSAGAYVFTITVDTIRDDPFSSTDTIRYEIWEIPNFYDSYGTGLSAANIAQAFNSANLTPPQEGIQNDYITNDLFFSWGDVGNHGQQVYSWMGLPVAGYYYNKAFRISGTFQVPATGQYRFAINSEVSADVFVDETKPDAFVSSHYGAAGANAIGSNEFSTGVIRNMKSLGVGSHTMVARYVSAGTADVYGCTVAWRRESSGTDTNGVDRDVDGSGTAHAEMTLNNRMFDGRCIYEIEVEMIGEYEFRWKKRRWASDLNSQNAWTGSRMNTWTTSAADIWWTNTIQGGPLLSVYGKPGKVYFNEAEGTEVGSIPALVSANQWYWDAALSRIYVYSTIDPDTSPQANSSAVIIEVDYEAFSTGQTWTTTENTEVGLFTAGLYYYVGNPSTGTKTLSAVVELARIEFAAGSTAGDKYRFTVGYERMPLSVFEATEATLSVDKYPYTVKYHDGRKFFGGTDYFPYRLWGSHVGLYESYSTGSNDDEGIETDAVGARLDKIQWLESFNRLIVGTAGAIFEYPRDDKLFTPANSQGRPIVKFGSKSVIPDSANDVIFFVDSSGTQVWAMRYGDLQGYQIENLTDIVEGKFSSDPIKEICYTKGSYFTYKKESLQILWVLTDGGKLHAFAYDKAQDFAAWVDRPIGGETQELAKVKSIAKIPLEDGSRLYALIHRTNLGLTLEYMDPNAFTDHEVTDSSPTSQYPGPSADDTDEYLVLTGLDTFLDLEEGDSLAAWATNGTRVYPLTLAAAALDQTDDRITVKSPLEIGYPGAVAGNTWADMGIDIQVGLYYEPTITPLTPEFEYQGGTTQGMFRGWADTFLQFINTLGRVTISRLRNTTTVHQVKTGNIKNSHYFNSDETNPQKYPFTISGASIDETYQIKQTSPTPMNLMVFGGEVKYDD